MKRKIKFKQYKIVEYKGWKIWVQSKITCIHCNHKVYWAQIVDSDGLHIQSTIWSTQNPLGQETIFGYSKTENAAIDKAKCEIRGILRG